MPKPEWISWGELAECQQKAHESNLAVGINMQCATYTSEQLYDAVKTGTTLVALNSRKELMGMLSVVIRDVNRWWHRGKAAYICYVAVAPEYQGNGVYKALAEKANEVIKAQDIFVEYLNTHERNVQAIKAYKKEGYQKVRFSPGSGTDYYSVEMVKWLGKERNSFLCNMMFVVTEIAVRILYKPGKRRRF